MNKLFRLRRASAASHILLALFIFAAFFAVSASASAARICDVTAYGAKGDGVTKDTHAIQSAIDACAAKGGGTVRLASGTFLTGPIVLKSHITLEVDAGATLLGSQDKADYPEVAGVARARPAAAHQRNQRRAHRHSRRRH